MIAIALWLWVGLASAGYGAVQGCGHASATPTRLQVLGAAIDPAYAAAVDGCIDAEEAIAEGARASTITADQARVLIGVIRERCEDTRERFDRFRGLHEAAQRALRAGDDRAAASIAAELEAAWTAQTSGGR